MMKEKKKEKETRQDLHPWEETVKEERFPPLGSPFTGREISWDRKGVSEA